MKRFKTPSDAAGFLFLVEGIPLGLIFVLQMVGVLDKMPYLFIALMAVAALGMGAGFMPGGVLKMEIMDYDVWKNGKERSALNNAVGKLIDKAQSALSTAAIGVVLTSIGYIVDSETDAFLGDLSAMPTMLNWFVVIMGLVPCVFGILGWLILKKYPITNEMRAEIQEAIKVKE